MKTKYNYFIELQNYNLKVMSRTIGTLSTVKIIKILNNINQVLPNTLKIKMYKN